MTFRIAQRANTIAALAAAPLFTALIELAHTQSFEGYRAKSLTVPPSNRVGFSLLTPGETGIQFTNSLNQSCYTTNQIYLNGSGVAAGDVDGDGWCDLYFCALDRPNALYRNRGNWKFTDIADSAGVACPGLGSTAAAFADLDGDGDLDLIVNSIGRGTHIFLNDGHAHFTRTAVLNEGKGGMSLAVADIDGDGALDFYVCNYRLTTLRDEPQTNFRINMVDGQPVVAFVNGEPTTVPKYQGRFSLNSSGNISEHGEADALYKNDGKGHFSLVQFTEGAFTDENGHPLRAPPYDWSLSAMFRDLNGDGLPDLYVCNDFESPDCVWINQGHGTFKALSRLALRNTSKFSMGVDVADIDRDGHDDLFILDMLSRDHVTRLTRADKSMETTPPGVIENRPQLTRNTLHLNRGDDTYAEIAYFAGLEASEWSWTAAFLDVDLDGYEDLLVTAGHGRDDMDIDNGLRIERTRRAIKMPALEELALRKTSPQLPAPKFAFRNNGHLQFDDMGPKWGFNQPGISHGMCLADLDNDGDLDVIVNNLNAAAGVYRNESSAPRIAVRLKGTGANTRGIGAKIKILGGAVPLQSQEMICGGRYLSSDDAMRVFAAGALSNTMRLQVTWRSGKQSLVENMRANSLYEIAEATAVEAPRPNSHAPAPLFEDATRSLGHQHHQDPFDDFARQALLPNRLSQLGPAVSWIDLDGDGRDDLVIGGGRGGHLGVFRNDSAQGFVPLQSPALAETVTRDQTGIVGLPQTNGFSLLLVALDNYQDGRTNGSSLRQYDLATGNITELLGAQISSTGPIALADIDGDGKLELFLGGRVIGARYPEPPSSLILRSNGPEWTIDHTNSAPLQQVGLVRGAVWTDLNDDGFPELVLAREWGPLKIFLNEKGRLRDVTEQFGMHKWIGWWNGVMAGDFDNDGRIDLVASNWGLNTKYRVHPPYGPRLYYAAWGAAGEIEMLEASFDPQLNRWVPQRDLNSTGRAIPLIREKFRTHRSYAEAGVEQILGERFKEAHVLEANWLETTLFLNRGDHFEIRALPPGAQFTPAFGINVSDFDGDGNEDIFLSQNFFAVQPQTSRNDAGRGLLLKGNGKGAFEALDGARSGIKVYGEQRGSAVADYDGDGRPDLVVSQNGAATTLWRNIAAKPGLRVRLQGPPFNPAGIGAILRVGFEDRWGPAREIHAGSGYWSQDSTTQVLATPVRPMSLQVLWPGGRKTTNNVPAGAKEITIPFKPDPLLEK